MNKFSGKIGTLSPVGIMVAILHTASMDVFTQVVEYGQNMIKFCHPLFPTYEPAWIMNLHPHNFQFKTMHIGPITKWQFTTSGEKNLKSYPL